MRGLEWCHVPRSREPRRFSRELWVHSVQSGTGRMASSTRVSTVLHLQESRKIAPVRHAWYFSRHMERRLCSLSYQWRIQGAPGTCALLLVKILPFSCSFRQNNRSLGSWRRPSWKSWICTVCTRSRQKVGFSQIFISQDKNCPAAILSNQDSVFQLSSSLLDISPLKSSIVPDPEH